MLISKLSIMKKFNDQIQGNYFMCLGMNEREIFARTIQMVDRAWDNVLCVELVKTFIKISLFLLNGPFLLDERVLI